MVPAPRGDKARTEADGCAIRSISGVLRSRHRAVLDRQPAGSPLGVRSLLP